MYTYNRYIIKTILPILGVIGICLISIVWTTQILGFINFIDRGITFKNFLLIIVLLLPYLLFMVMPIISVISIVYVYNKLQEERQIIILHSAGLNNYQISKPALTVSMLISIIIYYISVYLMPVSYNSLKHNLSHFKENYISNAIDARTFNQVAKNATLYVDKMNPNNLMEGIILFDNRAPENKTIFFAKKAIVSDISEDRIEFELLEGVRHSYDNAGHLTKLYFDNMIVNVMSNNTNSLTRNKTSFELFIHEMLWPSDSLSEEKKRRLITDGHSRLIWPLFNFVFVFLALSSFLRSTYNRRSNIRQYIHTFLPIIIVSYIHFTIQKLAYKDLDYVFLYYSNIFSCIIFSIWQNSRNRL